MGKLDHKEGWVLKSWCFRTVGLENSWESLGQQEDHQSILKEFNPECSLEELMLKVQVQYFGHLMGTVDSLEKTLMLRKIKGRRRRGQQRLRWLDSITNPMDMSLTKFWKIVRDRGAWLAVVHGVAKSQTQLSDWTTATMGTESLFCSHNILVADQVLDLHVVCSCSC